MRDANTGWFYVGNGRLRYKSLVGWTDRYQDIDGPAQTPEAGPAACPDASGPAVAEAGSQGNRSLLTRLASSATHRVIAGFLRFAAGSRP